MYVCWYSTSSQATGVKVPSFSLSCDPTFGCGRLEFSRVHADIVVNNTVVECTMQLFTRVHPIHPTIILEYA